MPVCISSTSDADIHSNVEAELLLQGDAVMGRRDLGFAEARHQIPLRDEPAVEREAVAAGGVEVLGAHAEHDRRFGAALRAHHARRPAARAVAERSLLEQDDALHAAFGELNRRPCADGSPADDDDVSAAAAGHTAERWHRLNSQSRARSGLR